MIPKQYLQFIEQVITATEEGKAKWKAVSNDNFILKTDKATVSVSYFSDDDRELTGYSFRYTNLANNKQAGFVTNHTEEDWNLMNRLYVVAAASANDIDKELEDFLLDITK